MEQVTYKSWLPLKIIKHQRYLFFNMSASQSIQMEKGLYLEQLLMLIEKIVRDTKEIKAVFSHSPHNSEHFNNTARTKEKLIMHI